MPVTLDISAESLKLVSFNGNRVEKWRTAPLSPGMVRDGVILQPQAVGAAIDALFQDLNITKGGVNATVTGLSFIYRMFRLPRVSSALMTEAILRAARERIPLALDRNLPFLADYRDDQRKNRSISLWRAAQFD